MERVDRGCEAEPSFARPDASDVAHLDRLRAFVLPARPLRLQSRLPHDGGLPFLAGDDAVAPELAADPAVPVAALAKIEPLGDEALQGLPLDPCVGFPLVEGKLRS